MLLYQRKYSYLIKEKLPCSRQGLNPPAGEAGIGDWRLEIGDLRLEIFEVLLEYRISNIEL